MDTEATSIVGACILRSVDIERTPLYKLPVGTGQSGYPRQRIGSKLVGLNVDIIRQLFSLDRGDVRAVEVPNHNRAGGVMADFVNEVFDMDVVRHTSAQRKSWSIPLVTDLVMHIWHDIWCQL